MLDGYACVEKEVLDMHIPFAPAKDIRFSLLSLA